MGHTIYFVGAGLSKSLELNHPVPLMADFIRVAAHYAETDTKPITLLALLGLELLDRCSIEETAISDGGVENARPMMIFLS